MEPPAPPTATGAAGVAVGAVVAAGEDGRATWRFPHPHTTPPILAALAFTPSSAPIVVVLEEVTTAYATVRAWHATGLATPADGVHIHLTATPATLMT